MKLSDTEIFAVLILPSSFEIILLVVLLILLTSAVLNEIDSERITEFENFFDLLSNTFTKELISVADKGLFTKISFEIILCISGCSSIPFTIFNTNLPLKVLAEENIGCSNLKIFARIIALCIKALLSCTKRLTFGRTSKEPSKFSNILFAEAIAIISPITPSAAPIRLAKALPTLDGFVT